MYLEQIDYPAIVHIEDDQFWIEFPDFPEAGTYGYGIEDDPATLAEDCLLDAIAARLEFNQFLPIPSVVETGQMSVSIKRPLGDNHTFREFLDRRTSIGDINIWDDDPADATEEHVDLSDEELDALCARMEQLMAKGIDFGFDGRIDRDALHDR